MSTLHISLVGGKSLSHEVYRQIRDAVVSGVLRPGDRLPATRELAATLNIARMTVIVAYERLAAEGFVVTRRGHGTFVNPEAVRPVHASPTRSDSALEPRRLWNGVPLPTAFAEPARFDFRTGVPDALLFPHREWRRLVAGSVRLTPETAALYGDPAGHPALRSAIARHLAISRGLAVIGDDVLVTTGTQQAIDLVARVLLEAGDRVGVEDPGYWPVRRAFQALGLRVVGVPVDPEGLQVERIPRNVRAVYITPSHQYPTGVSMSLRRRQALLGWADRHHAAIIEDDYDTEYRFHGRPVDPLRAIDSAGRVVYVASFSKTLLPSIRLGFVIAPKSLQPALRRAKFLADWHSPTWIQTALARFIDEGGFARHLRRARKIYAERRAMIERVLTRDFANELELIPSVAGLHVSAWTRHAPVPRVQDIARRALDAGVAIQTLATFSVEDTCRPGIMLGYGAIATTDIVEGLRRLRSCFKGAR